jgi:hypothetical protein
MLEQDREAKAIFIYPTKVSPYLPTTLLKGLNYIIFQGFGSGPKGSARRVAILLSGFGVYLCW